MSGMTDMLMIGLIAVGAYMVLKNPGILGGTPAAATPMAPAGPVTNITNPLPPAEETYEDEDQQSRSCDNFRNSAEEDDAPCGFECGSSGNQSDCHNCERACGYDSKEFYNIPYFPGPAKYSTGRGLSTKAKCYFDNCGPDCREDKDSDECQDCLKECGYGTNVPLEASKTTPGALTPKLRSGSQKSRSESTGGGVGGRGKVVPGTPKSTVPVKKPCPTRCAPLKNSPSSYKSCCASAKYATAYLGSAFSNRGPSYNYRDVYGTHGMRIPRPQDPDWRGMASRYPYYLGPRNPERRALIDRFSNMAITIA